MGSTSHGLSSKIERRGGIRGDGLRVTTVLASCGIDIHSLLLGPAPRFYSVTRVISARSSFYPLLRMFRYSLSAHLCSIPDVFSLGVSHGGLLVMH